MYERFFDIAQQNGRRKVRCITSPVNKTSVAFHLRMGFQLEPQDEQVDGLPVYANYDGRGDGRVLFVKRLEF